MRVSLFYIKHNKTKNAYKFEEHYLKKNKEKYGASNYWHYVQKKI